MAKVFISYHIADRAPTLRLAEALRERGHDVWTADWEIELGDSITRRIDAAITDASYVIFVFSAASSSWMEREFLSALSRQLSESHVRMLPAVLHGGTVPSILADTKFTDLTADWQQSIDALDKVLTEVGYSSSPQAAVAPNDPRRSLSTVDLNSVPSSGNHVAAASDDFSEGPIPTAQSSPPLTLHKPMQRLRRRSLWRAFTDGIGGTFDVFGGARVARDKSAVDSDLADDVHAVCLVLGLVGQGDYDREGLGG